MAGRRNLFEHGRPAGAASPESEPVSRSAYEDEPQSVREPEPGLDSECCQTERGGAASRLSLQSRKGRLWSYPYAYLSLIEVPSPERLILHPNCGAVEIIEVKGRGLDRLLPFLNSQRLTWLIEAEHPAYAEGDIVVAEILVKRVHRKADA